MAPNARWDVAYAECFKNQPEGFSLYKKVLVTKLKPGTCGYFDEQGDWQPIVDLTKPAELKMKGYTEVYDIEVTEDEGGENWKFRASASMYRSEKKVAASVENPALPAGGGLTVGYKTSSGQGAVLVTDGNVLHTQANPPFKMCEWMKDNGEAIIRNNPDAREKGVWIITKTYSAKRRALAYLESKESEVTLDINVSADNVGKVEATASWWKNRIGGTWNVHDAEAGVVLSINGIYWKDHWYDRSIKPVTVARMQQFLSGNKGDVILSPVDFALQPTHDSEIFTVELEPEIRGQVDGVRLFDPDNDGPKEGDRDDVAGDDNEEGA